MWNEYFPLKSVHKLTCLFSFCEVELMNLAWECSHDPLTQSWITFDIFEIGEDRIVIAYVSEHIVSATASFIDRDPCSKEETWVYQV